ncbi:MAG: LysR substrate-binding domain-containing protein [bacterium]
MAVSACAAAGFAPRVAQEARQLDALVALVSAGLGVTFVPSTAERLPREGGLPQASRTRPTVSTRGPMACGAYVAGPRFVPECDARRCGPVVRRPERAYPSEAIVVRFALLCGRWPVPSPALVQTPC